MSILKSEQKKRHNLDANALEEPRYSTVPDLAGFFTSSSFTTQFDSDVLFMDLSRTLDPGRLKQKVETLENQLRIQRIRYAEANRRNAALESDLETCKRREFLLLETLEHERDNSRPAISEPGEVDPADLERIRRTFAPRLSEDDIVGMVRSVRDEA